MKEQRRKKKKKKARREEGNGISLEMRTNNFTKIYGQTVCDELLVGIKGTMLRNRNLMEVAEIFVRDTSDDLGPNTPAFIIEKRCVYLILLSLPVELTDKERMRSGFWFGTNAKELAKMSAMELDIKGGSMDGYSREATSVEGAAPSTSTSKIKAKAKKKSGGQGIGAAIMQKLKSDFDLSFKDAQKIAQEINPDTKFSQSSFNWYRNKVKKENK